MCVVEIPTIHIAYKRTCKTGPLGSLLFSSKLLYVGCLTAVSVAALKVIVSFDDSPHLLSSSNGEGILARLLYSQGS